MKRKNYIGTKTGENEYRLTRVEAYRVYCEDSRARMQTIVTDLPSNTKQGKQSFVLRTGAILCRQANGGAKPFKVHGAGAKEVLTIGR